MPRFVAGHVAALLLTLCVAVFAAPLAAKPIPLTQPLDLAGQRVLVVPLLGRSAGAYSVSRMVFGRYSREQGDAAGVFDIDALSARETRDRLRGFDVEAEVHAMAYEDIDIYGDHESLFNTQMPRRWQLDAIAARLLREHRVDAVLLLARSGVSMGQYRPPAIGYGVILQRHGGMAYASMLQVLYVQGRKKPLVVRGTNAIKAVEGISAQEHLDYPPAQTWRTARPAVDDLAGRLARSLAAEVYDRARRPPQTATSVWRSIYPREDLVDPL